MRTSLRISWLLKYSASSTILNSANAWLVGPSDLPTQTLHAYSPGKCSQSPFRTNHEHRRHPFCALADGTAYVSKEIPKNPGDREEVIRFKNPGGTVSFTDVIRGEITTGVDDLGDFIIARSF